MDPRRRRRRQCPLCSKSSPWADRGRIPVLTQSEDWGAIPSPTDKRSPCACIWRFSGAQRCDILALGVRPDLAGHRVKRFLLAFQLVTASAGAQEVEQVTVFGGSFTGFWQIEYSGWFQKGM